MQVSCIQNYKLQGLQEVWPLIRRFDGLKMDRILKREAIKAFSGPRGLQFELPNNGNSPLLLDYTSDVLENIATYCDIDKGDLQKEAEKYPHIAAMRINAWMRDEAPLNKNKKRPVTLANTKHLIRAYRSDHDLMELGIQDGVLRAIKSDRFKLGLDASDVLSVLMKLLLDKKDTWQDVKVEVSASDQIVHFVVENRSLTKATKLGDLICASLRGRTSDIGKSSLIIESRAVKLVCLNGMTTGYDMKKAHLGKKQDEDNFDMYSDTTRKLQTATLLSEMYDVMSVCFDEMAFSKVISKIDENQDIHATDEQAKQVFETVTVTSGLSDNLKDALFSAFLQERKPDNSRNTTKDGVVQAVTHFGRQLAIAESYEKAITLEDLGGKIFSLNSDQWRELITVAPKQGAKILN